MELKEGKEYHVRINKEKASYLSLIRGSKIVKDKPLLVCYTQDLYFRVIDKRLAHLSCYQNDYYISRFIIEEQLEFDF